jgi:hypothetical protein
MPRERSQGNQTNDREGAAAARSLAGDTPAGGGTIALASQELIESLKIAIPPARKRRVSVRSPAAGGEYSRTCDRGERTQRQQREDERWERIFQAKFADPFYYAPGQIRRASTLSDPDQL